MPKKIFALVPSAREEECDHRHVPFTGRVPCTGPRRCSMCGAWFEDDGKTPLKVEPCMGTA